MSLTYDEIMRRLDAVERKFRPSLTLAASTGGAVYASPRGRVLDVRGRGGQGAPQVTLLAGTQMMAPLTVTLPGGSGFQTANGTGGLTPGRIYNAVIQVRGTMSGSLFFEGGMMRGNYMSGGSVNEPGLAHNYYFVTVDNPAGVFWLNLGPTDVLKTWNYNIPCQIAGDANLLLSAYGPNAPRPNDETVTLKVCMASVKVSFGS